MKNTFLLVFAALATLGVTAQIKTPAPSPAQTIEQTVGLTDINVEYSRPAMRGRTIFGDLVPYGAMWRTGANANTKISFSQPVEIGGSTVKAGDYAIFTKPGAKEWEVYFYTDTNNWGTPQNWDEGKVAAKATVPTYPMPMDIESFTLSFDDVTHDSTTLGILWENTYVGVPIKVMTDKQVSANIDRVMNGPAAADYYAAAVYYLETGKDINQAKTWIDKALEMAEEPAFWQYRQQSLIYAKAGDKKGAIKAAQKSLELAKQANNSDYVALNEKSLKEWGAM
ncbi:MAG: dihydrolipoamide dehydrogenase [Flavobacteriaceae bacterium]|nr:dihydrolipoamide dehydrogenase [Flavobacteriaceae bacterium]